MARRRLETYARSMRSLLLVTLLLSCTELPPNLAYDGPGSGGDAGPAPGEQGNRSQLPPARLSFQGTFGPDGKASFALSGSGLDRLPFVQAWQERSASTWSTDVVARVHMDGSVEIEGVPGARYQALVLP